MSIEKKIMPWEVDGTSRSTWYRLRKAEVVA